MKKIIALLLLVSTYAHSQITLVQEESQSIVGVWVVENESNNKWVFTASNTCRWEFNGATIKNFVYEITSELSPNGIQHTYLKLLNANETYEYEINGISSENLTLETFEPKLGYIYFHKQ